MPPTATETATATATVTHTPTVTPTVPAQADLSMALSISNPTPIYWNTVTLTAVVTNNGPIDATGVSVAVPLPTGLTFVSADSGSYTGGVWTVGTLANGASATLHITARAGAVNLGARTVTATASSTTTDLNTSNNAASVSSTSQTAFAEPTIVAYPGNPPIVDITSPGAVGWNAVLATNAPGAPREGTWFWTCETFSTNPCPFVTELTNGDFDHLAFQINTLQLDTYIITLTYSPLPLSENFTPNEPTTTQIQFTTTSGGGF